MASRHSLKTSMEWLGLETKKTRERERGGHRDQLLRRRPATGCLPRHTEGALSGH